MHYQLCQKKRVGLFGSAAELNKKVANVKTSLMNLGRLARGMMGSADDISKYNKNLEDDLIPDNDPIYLEALVGSGLISRVAPDEYSAAAGNFEEIDPDNVRWWTDKPLKFQKNEKTDAYDILQQDENGEWKVMDRTDETGYLNYIKTFNGKLEERKNATINDMADKFKKTSIGATIASGLSSAYEKEKDNQTYSKDDYLIEKAKQEEKVNNNTNHVNDDFKSKIEEKVNDIKSNIGNKINDISENVKSKITEMSSSKSNQERLNSFRKINPTDTNDVILPDNIKQAEKYWTVSDSKGENVYYMINDKKGNNMIIDSQGAVLMTDTSGKAIKNIDTRDNIHVTITYKDGSDYTYLIGGE